MFTINSSYLLIAVFIVLLLILSTGKSNSAIKKQVIKERERAKRPLPPKVMMTKKPKKPAARIANRI